MSFWKSLGKVAQAAVPVVVGAAMPEAIANTMACGALKHGTAINNQAIPVVNMVASTIISYLPKAIETGDWVTPIMPALHEGGLLTAGSIAIHQGLKIPLASMVTGEAARRVGPGDRFSI